MLWDGDCPMAMGMGFCPLGIEMGIIVGMGIPLRGR